MRFATWINYFVRLGVIFDFDESLETIPNLSLEYIQKVVFIFVAYCVDLFFFFQREIRGDER